MFLFPLLYNLGALREQIHFYMQNFLDITDKIKFSCHKDVACLNACCRDVNIFLTPYDIVRLKKALEISSQEFLDKYTVSPFSKEQKIPVIVLKLNKNDKACPFAGHAGCSVYADRPRACRMYPINENTHDITKETDKPFVLLEDNFCLGHKEDRSISVSEYLNEQGIGKYNEMLEYFNQIISHNKIIEGNGLNDKQIGMFYMACYNIDKFREFVFESTFLNRFKVDKEEVENIKEDDIELLKFGTRWLRFSLFGEKLFQLKGENK